MSRAATTWRKRLVEAAARYAARPGGAREKQELLAIAELMFDACLCNNGWAGPPPEGPWRGPGGTDESLPVRPLCPRCEGKRVVIKRGKPPEHIDFFGFYR